MAHIAVDGESALEDPWFPDRCGHPSVDQSRVGLIFSKQAPEKRVLTLQLTNDHFVIPPGEADYRVEARGTLPNDALLLSFLPHMHLRGKRFEYNLVHEHRNVAGKPAFEIEPLPGSNWTSSGMFCS